MAKLTKKNIEAAVKVYGPLFTEGKTEDEIKVALAADEKAYTEDQIDQIYAAISAGENEDQAEYTVLKSFRDKDNFDKVYDSGDTISGFSQERIDHLLEIGYIEEA
jgi:uncharacterized membrane-anchored protein